MDHDTMSVHELIGEAMELVYRLHSHLEPIDSVELASIESALRKAAIREASVGTVHVLSDGTGYTNVRKEDGGDIEDGAYDLISKETP